MTKTVHQSSTSRRVLLRRATPERNGAILMVIALILPVIFILGAFAINMAYIQLTRTELMVATDAATRAAGRALSQYQDVDSAIGVAQSTAALNSVGGMALRLDISDAANVIEFGDADQASSDGRFTFSKVSTAAVRQGTLSADAIRVTGFLTSGSLTGPLKSLFPTFAGSQDFQLSSQAVAMQLDRDIALVLDRSGSMDYVDYDWPSGNSPWTNSALNAGVSQGILGYSSSHGGYYYYQSGQNSTSYQNYIWEDYYELGPAPLSVWQQLEVAVNTFLTVLEGTEQNEQVSLTTYSTYGRLDLGLRQNYDDIRDELEGTHPSGSTGIGRGMATGMPTLLSASARPYAAKTLVVMTDGHQNSGTSPITQANTIVAANDVTIHTVTFGSGADQDLMQEVAEIGGGTHFHADDGAELSDVFEEIANNLPTIITN